MSAASTYQDRMADTPSHGDLVYDDRSTTFNDILARGHPEGDTTWGLVNLIGLTLFLTAVIGPIAYVTFCCRRPVTGERCLCGRYWQKAMSWFWWQPQQLRPAEDGRGTGPRPSCSSWSASWSWPSRTAAAAAAHEPPSYEAAVSMTKAPPPPPPPLPPPSFGQMTTATSASVSASGSGSDDVYVLTGCEDGTGAGQTDGGPGSSAECDWTLVDCYAASPLVNDCLPSYEDYMSMVNSTKRSASSQQDADT